MFVHHVGAESRDSLRSPWHGRPARGPHDAIGAESGDSLRWSSGLEEDEEEAGERAIFLALVGAYRVNSWVVKCRIHFAHR